ncbi:NADH-dependent butanol dehydrogenase A [Clostridiales bacterium CHKCI001]|nr:NADH-dependent butanol dehydrogenase A [Clostridiales bacterium CHKCI001]
MQNFYYNIPTKIYFGKGQIEQLGKNLKAITDHVLLAYGGGSIKKNGLYDKVIEQLKNAGIQWEELSGIEPNPRIESVRKGVEICKKHGIGAVLAVGGGSTIDCAKIIASGTCYDGDPWDQVIDNSKITKALPVVSVLTLAATGSEMDGFAVISDLTKNEKWGTGNDITKPVFSILDPEYTFTVSARQTAAGTADIMSHTFENYFTTEKGAYLQARFCESILKTCIHYAPIAIQTPDNYEARANLMWASSMAINGICSYGENTAWAVHPMEHELSAFYDITHGVGLAILTPFWMEYVLNEDTVWRFVEYGKNVWGILEGSDMEIAKEAIAKTKAFFASIGLPSSLHEIGIDETHFDVMAQKAADGGLKYGFIPLNKEDVKKIFQMAL